MRIPKQKSKRTPALIILSASAVLLVGAALTYYYTSPPATQPPIDNSQPQKQATEKKDIAVAEIPIRMEIEKIGVDAPIGPVGLDSNGAMDAPKTNKDVGWYNQSARIGESAFSILLDGHYGTDSRPAVFYRLAELTASDIITLHGVNGKTVRYEVMSIEQTLLEDVDMKRALYPSQPGAQSLTIITCDGDYDTQRATYESRTVVYAERVDF